jgi:hypothetical protein
MFGLLQGAIAQNLQLDDVIQIGKEGGEAHGTALALGDDGSTVIAGYFSGPFDWQSPACYRIEITVGCESRASLMFERAVFVGVILKGN